MKPSKSFVDWINNMKDKSPLWYVVKDDAAVKKARKDVDDEPKTEEDKEKEEKDSFRKFQQTATTTVNN